MFHNAANVVSLVLAGLTAALVASGCTELSNGSLACTASWLNPAWTTGAIAALQILKLGVNIARDGLFGLVKQQPPVK